MSAAFASEAQIEEHAVRRAGGRAFLVTSALLFAVAASGTILWYPSMSPMGEMPMPGGWNMSMLWMRMPGQTWAGAGASFLGMWTVMMVAMMLPSLVPVLWRYVASTDDVGEAGNAPSWLAALIGSGYFFVWIALGAAVFPLGIALAALEMQEPALARSVPIMIGAVVLGAGALQFTAWKAHHLTLCREIPCSSEANAVTALRCGLRLGIHCSLSSAGLTAILLAAGMMNLRAMAAVTAAITVERLVPADQRVARAIGALAVGAGLLLIISAV